MVQTVKLKSSLMMFAVIGIPYKPRFFVIEQSISTDKCMENCYRLGFIDELDLIHRPPE
jgi:hypothetical protein